jgi:hypothetical protein
VSLLFFSIVHLLLLDHILVLIHAQGTEFNNEVIARVTERIADFMNIPIESTARISEYRNVGGFSHDMGSLDRDFAFRLLSIEKAAEVYYGLEDGTYVFYSDTFYMAIYREPGEDGYNARRVPTDLEKHYKSCLVPGVTGDIMNCTMSSGSQYVKCHNNCDLVRCPDENSQKDCSMLGENRTDRTECERNVKWCRNYTVEYAQEDEQLGYIPVTKYCLNDAVQPTQTLGATLDPTTRKNTNCTYDYGESVLVNRYMAGDYAYCGGNGTLCNNTFVGGYTSVQYDPRYRGWYTQTKAAQKALWTEPYPFHEEDNMGLTYTKPIYNTDDDGKQVFRGVLAVDYDLKHIMKLLVVAYQGTDRLVMIVEDAAPNYLIAASTGSSSIRQVLEDDKSELCPGEDARCTVIRIPVHDFNNNTKDMILQRAFLEHQRLGFPMNDPVATKESDKIGAAAFVSKGGMYNQDDTNMQWRVFVVTPMKRSITDASLPGDLSFVITCVLASIGFIGCGTMLWMFFSKRADTAMVCADWRFTCAFLFGCTVTNLTSFTLLGENTDSLCMLRMWSFNLLFVSGMFS